MVSKHREWREIQMTAIKAVEINLEQELLTVVPAGLKFYFREEINIIPNLLEFGKADRRYADNDFKTLGCADYRAFKNQLVLLKKAWAGVVEIRISKWDPGRYDVKFLAI